MTVIDLSAKPLRVRISYGDGSSPLNVTPLLLSFSAQDGQEYSSGLIKTSGKLTLHCNPIEPFPESRNPRENPARWARGNLVEVDYLNPDGTFTRHERGRMRILKTPAPPTSDRRVCLRLPKLKLILPWHERRPMARRLKRWQTCNGS